MTTERRALDVLFEAIRRVRVLVPEPERPSRQVLDAAAREAERIVEEAEPSRGIW